MLPSGTINYPVLSRLFAKELPHQNSIPEKANGTPRDPLTDIVFNTRRPNRGDTALVVGRSSVLGISHSIVLSGS